MLLDFALTKAARTLRLPYLLLLAIACLGLSSRPASAAPPEGAPTLEIPLACKMNVDCSIQKYFDHDPGPGAKDYMCGSLVNDKDEGIDIRIPSYVDMRRGVPVLAAAPGVVWRTRDGIEDIDVRKIGAATVMSYGLGNVVVIDHGHGWRTFYGHMLKGSLKVKQGDHVVAGQELGLVGLSGLTEFPHVDFMVMHGDMPIDPFTGTAVVDPIACGDISQSLWSAKAQAEMPYTPTGPLLAGFSTDKPDRESATSGDYDKNPMPATASTLYFWAEYFGLQKGDHEILRIAAPDGSVLADYDQFAEGGKVLMFRYVGVKAPEGGFKPGVYHADFKLLRAKGGSEQTIIDVACKVELQ